MTTEVCDLNTNRYEQQCLINNKLGLHARAAVKLVTLANQFNATITLCHGDKKASANSVLALLVLASHQGQEITLITEGDDAKQAMAAISELISDRFEEGE